MRLHCSASARGTARRENSFVPSQSAWNDHTCLREWVLLDKKAGCGDKGAIRPVVRLSGVAYLVGRGQRTISRMMTQPGMSSSIWGSEEVGTRSGLNRTQRNGKQTSKPTVQGGDGSAHGSREVVSEEADGAKVTRTTPASQAEVKPTKYAKASTRAEPKPKTGKAVVATEKAIRSKAEKTAAPIVGGSSTSKAASPPVTSKASVVAGGKKCTNPASATDKYAMREPVHKLVSACSERSCAHQIR